MPPDFGLANCHFSCLATAINTLRGDFHEPICASDIEDALSRRGVPDPSEYTRTLYLRKLLKIIKEEFGADLMARDVGAWGDPRFLGVQMMKKALGEGVLLAHFLPGQCGTWLKYFRGLRYEGSNKVIGHRVLITGYLRVRIGMVKETFFEVCDPYDGKIVTIRLEELFEALRVEGPLGIFFPLDLQLISF